MATSGSTNFSQTTTEIVTDALGMIGVLGNSQTLEAEDANRAIRVLNRLVKSLQNQSNHLWKRSEFTLFLQQDQASYVLGGSSSDHATESFVQYELSVDAASSATSLTVADTTGVTNGDYIGIVLDDGSTHWTTVVSHTSTTFTITTGLASSAAIGNVVYTYTTKILKPLNILDVRRRNVSDSTDVPIVEETYEGYFRLPTKETPSGTVIKWHYARNNSNGTLYVWPPPENGNYQLKCTYSKSFEDFDSTSDNPDFPQEWYKLLVLGTAVDSAPYYERTGTQEYQDLLTAYKSELALVLPFDSENTYIQFVPDYRSK